MRNTAVSPAEEKFKRIKLSNSKIKSSIVEATGGVPTLLAMGWVPDSADSEFLMLPKGTQMTMKEVGCACIRPNSSYCFAEAAMFWQHPSAPVTALAT